MKVLLLGGTGAIGSALAPILTAQRHDVTVTSRAKMTLENDSVTYICGNAKDLFFLENVLKQEWDVIVDFMVYSSKDFAERMEMLLLATKQYLFFSSARVFALSKEPISETSARLLDVSTDDDYLRTDEYALAKAREEDMLKSSKHKNWTIVRPYITYSEERLQLGVLEKEHWLYRALRGRTIVFTEDIAKSVTTMTSGRDVAIGIARLLGNDDALGEIFNITSQHSAKWEDILNIYLDVIEEVTSSRPKLLMLDTAEYMYLTNDNKYQIIYDRYYDRYFNNEKIISVYDEDFEFELVENGLKRCVKSFILENKQFKIPRWKHEAYLDRLCKEHTPLSEISNINHKWYYLKYRYSPYFFLKENGLMKRVR